MMLLAPAVLLIVALASDALAQTAPRIPSSDLPGRERERFIDQPFPPVPRIELQDGRPKPVIEQRKKAKPKRNKRRTR
jgi:hypothetical protein